MADLTEKFTQVFLTYKDVKEANPEWSDIMIEDYLSIKRDLTTTADSADEVQDSEVEEAPQLRAQMNELRAQLGTGDPLTADETGFTADTSRITADRTRA